MAIKTLHLTNAYHPTSGGIRTFYRALLARADDEQRHVRLVVPGVEDGEAPVGRFGRIHAVQARTAPVFDRRYRLILPDAYLPARSSRLQRILEAEQPDLVEICDKYAIPYLAAMLRKHWLPRVARPALVGLSCERMDDNLAAYLAAGPAGRTFARWYLRHIYGPPFDSHIANSEYTAAELRRSLWDRDPDFIEVCPMGVDFGMFGPDRRDRSLRRRLLEDAGGTAQSALLLYAGRLSPEKNVPLLFEMLEHLTRRTDHPGRPRDVRLVMAGDGPLASALREHARRLAPGRVLWVGSINDRAALARHYASADVFVHPNPREPFGIGPLEAMASQVPTVVPAAGGVLTYAHDGNAWLAEPDGASFAAAVRSALSQPNPARLAAARETARRHDWPTIAGRYFALYDRLHQRQQRRMAAAGTRSRIAAPVTRDLAPATTGRHGTVTSFVHSVRKEGEVTQ